MRSARRAPRAGGRRRHIGRGIAAAVVLLAAGCREPAPPVVRIASTGEQASLTNGLVQSISLSPVSPAQGENLTIHSVIINRGPAPVTLESRICGLTLDGDLALQPPPDIGMCAGHSTTGPLAPGDSVASTEIKRVASPPGRYRLRVLHALSPETWVELPITVRAP